jgi:hypothetical protein
MAGGCRNFIQVGSATMNHSQPGTTFALQVKVAESTVKVP